MRNKINKKMSVKTFILTDISRIKIEFYHKTRKYFFKIIIISKLQELYNLPIKKYNYLNNKIL